MNETTYSMLKETLGCFIKAFSSKRLGWDRFLEVIAADHQFSLVKGMEDVFTWIGRDRALREAFVKTYQRDLLQGDCYDYLGELYFEIVFTGDGQSKSQRLPSLSQLERTLDSFKAIQDERTLSVLDPAAATGRVLLALKQANPRIVLFGVESDLDLYRIALTNFAIQGISGYLLHADPQYHEVDIALPAGRANWGYANRWGSAMADLLPTALTTARERQRHRGDNGDSAPC